MKALNLPPYSFRLKKKGEQNLIFDEVRKKWLVCTPEEWVRQHLVMYLHNILHYPLGLIAIEKGVKVNTLSRRVDILLYNAKGEPAVLVECKAPEIKINQKVFDQIARYNIPLKVPILVVSNGLDNYCCSVNFDTESYTFLDDIPFFKDL